MEPKDDINERVERGQMESSWRGRMSTSSCRRHMPEEEAGDRGEAAAFRETGGGEGRHRAGSPLMTVFGSQVITTVRTRSNDDEL
jgi:hypothetical protein